MKTKVYRVSLKKNPSIYYLVDAPSRRIAKWCGANLYNHEYIDFYTDKDMTVKRFKVETVDDNTTVCS